ncbi:MAG: hypothetical protein KDK72_02650 [Chlamydiia bacterium]|nr:hypothetical protein [Chlamydiia bacterium]
MKMIHMPKYVAGVRTAALLETLFFLTALTVGDYFFGAGDRMITLSPHPFWIIILLISVQYGTFEGLSAALLSTLFLYVGNVPQQTIRETLFEYQFQLALRPLLWFMAAFILGELRNRLAMQNKELEGELQKLREESDEVVKNYESLKNAKENLEAHLVTQQRSTAMTYKTLKGLESLNPAQIIMKLNGVVEAALNLKKFSVYTLGPNGLEVATSHGWSDDDRYLLRITPDNLLYRELVSAERIICLINKEDQKILGDQGVLAGPLIDSEEGFVFGMLKVEEIEFLELNTSSIETFRTVCELIGMAYTNARQHKKVEESSLLSSKPLMFSYHFYTVQKKLFLALARQRQFPLSLAKVSFVLSGTEKEEEDQLEGIKRFFKDNIPQDGSYFHDERGRGKFLLLLPYQHPSDVEQLAVALVGKVSNYPNIKDIKLHFSIEELYSPEGKTSSKETSSS